MEITPAIGVGAGDLEAAVRAEVERIVKETKGNALEQTKLLHHRLQELDLIRDGEVETLSRLAELSSEAASGKRSAQSAYFEARGLFNSMLAGNGSSAVALAIASGSVGSYTISENPDGSGTVIFAKSSGDWGPRGAAIGALIGLAIGGPAGAGIGTVIGEGVGHAVDECLGKA